MTVSEAEEVLQRHLSQYVRTPEVSVALAELGASQQVRGDYIVAPDGMVTLGSYGGVLVVGRTLPEAKMLIEAHLSHFLEDPTISIQVASYNSKVYYVIVQGAGIGDGVYRLPVTGNETVLDAIAQLNGFEPVCRRVWIARPSDVPGQGQILRSTGTRSANWAPATPTTKSCLATACSSRKTSWLRLITP